MTAAIFMLAFSLPLVDQLRTYYYTNRIEIPNFLAASLVRVSFSSPIAIVNRPFTNIFYTRNHREEKS